MKLYAAYGSNLNIEQMSIRCPRSTVVGKGHIDGFKLVFRGPAGCGVANIERTTKHGANVPVLIWNLSLTDEINLDRYEGAPYLYRKTQVCVHMDDGSKQMTMAYIMNPGPAKALPSAAYFQTLTDGYDSAEFDLDYLLTAAEKSVEKGRTHANKTI